MFLKVPRTTLFHWRWRALFPPKLIPSEKEEQDLPLRGEVFTYLVSAAVCKVETLFPS